MITRTPLVHRFKLARFWTMVTWFLLSGRLVQPATAAYGEVPIYFVKNHGQFGPHGSFAARGAPSTVFFDSTEVLIAAGGGTVRLSFLGRIQRWRLRAWFVRLRGSTSSLGRLSNGGHAWDRVAYGDIFRGIDLIYSSPRGRLKSEFIV